VGKKIIWETAAYFRQLSTLLQRGSAQSKQCSCPWAPVLRHNSPSRL